MTASWKRVDYPYRVFGRHAELRRHAWQRDVAYRAVEHREEEAAERGRDGVVDARAVQPVPVGVANEPWLGVSAVCMAFFFWGNGSAGSTGSSERAGSNGSSGRAGSSGRVGLAPVLPELPALPELPLLSSPITPSLTSSTLSNRSGACRPCVPACRAWRRRR